MVTEMERAVREREKRERYKKLDETLDLRPTYFKT